MRKLGKNYFLFWQGKTISGIGDVLYSVAIGFWILAVTGSSIKMSVVVALAAIPPIIISPLIGPLIDRVNKKRILVVADMARGGLTIYLAISLMTHQDQMWPIYILSFLIGICDAFFEPTSDAIIPEIVSRDKLIEANSLRSVAETGTSLLGNPVASFLYTVLGAPILVIANGITFILSGISEIFIICHSALDKESERKGDYKAELKEGFSYAFHTKGIFELLILGAFLNFFVNAAIICLMPYFEFEEIDISFYGVVMMAMTAGMLVGGILPSKINVGKMMHYPYFVGIEVIALIAFAVAILGNVWWMAVMFFVGGFCNILFNSLFMSLLQSIIEENMLGRFFALMGALVQGMLPLSLIFGGVMAELFPIKDFYMICFGVALILFVIVSVSNNNIKMALNRGAAMERA